MPSGKKPISCIPCAKRKVRCDRLQPCCHCRRRRQDTCIYPDANGTAHSLFREQCERIEKLERYIQNLGGNPKHASDAPTPRISEDRTLQEATNLTDASTTCSPSVSWSLHGGSSPQRSLRRVVPGDSELLAHSDGVTYIETPMWYSWRGHDESSSSHGPRTKSSDTHNLPTILNQSQNLYGDDFAPLPVSLHLDILWPVFLKNVHPLVKIFFDWEVAPIVEQAQRDAATLRIEEVALLNAIRFIATLTLTQEECQRSLSEPKHDFLPHCQRNVEYALIKAQYSESTDKRVLQAFMLYILAIRDRTRPSAIHPLMGIASRIAERMGLHRDGSTFGLSPLRCEERRRIWWQLQFMELAVARLVGTLSLTIFATWDTKMPSNLEDADFSLTTDIMPDSRKGLTSISPCLWRYSILQRRRNMLDKNHSGDLSWMLSPHLSLAEKDSRIDDLEKFLAERFIQHCELLNPLHVHMQIGIRLFGLAARSNVRQPTLVNAKISELRPQVRGDLLEICSKSLEYFILSQTTPSISGLRWANDIFFQGASFVYVVLEAHQRSSEPQAVDLWNLIGRVYEVHPDLMTAVNRPEADFIARITVSAWQKHALEMRQQSSDATLETPEWIQQLCYNFNLPLAEPSTPHDTQSIGSDLGQLLPIDFDFDMIDWSAWEALR